MLTHIEILLQNIYDYNDSQPSNLTNSFRHIDLDTNKSYTLSFVQHYFMMFTIFYHHIGFESKKKKKKR